MPTDVNGVTHIVSTPGGKTATRTESQAPGGEQARAGSTRPAPTDSVELRTPGQIQALTASLRSEPVVDGQRVQEVRAALSAGELRVNPERIADKLVEFEGMLETKLSDLV